MKPGKIREDAITAGALAGLCGGMAEIAWVSAYSIAGGTSAVAVAREVIASIAPAAAGLSAAPLLGIALHLLLSAALGIIFGLAIGVDPSRAFRRTSTILAAIGMLLIVWVINFFVLLPLFHPPFVTLMSLPATLVSKLLFGLTMGWIFHCMAASQTQPDVYRSALETGKAG